MSPDIRKHRGAHPADEKLFAADQLPALRTAVADLSWLLTHDYTLKSALKLVGDRHAFTDRQRLAVARAACSDQSKQHRSDTNLPVAAVAGEELMIDGFNLIITIEAALSGGLLFRGRDGCIRDLSGVHGSYRLVRETGRAIALAGAALQDLRPSSSVWFLDRPISNSGRLAQRLHQLSQQYEWNWQVNVVPNPDTEIIKSGRSVISADSFVLDQVDRWINFTSHLLHGWVKNFWLIDLSG
jgi:hypothetical protein